MARKSVDLKISHLRKLKKYYRDPMAYARRIKAIVRRHDRKARVLLFGSFVKGDMKPSSDIDVLVITRIAENLNDRL